jgi:prepilin-type N-terminal cleavage/methylation domain-containing protein
MSKLMEQTHARRAFTLLEVLVVVVVLGILAAIMTPSIASARREARDGRRTQDMNAVGKALELYINDFGVYPIVPTWSADAPSYGGKGYEGPTAYIPGLSPNYMAVLPRDPNSAYPTGGRGYLYYSNGADYKFLAHQTPDSFPADNPLLDPRRPTHAWAIYSSGGRNW